MPAKAKTTARSNKSNIDPNAPKIIWTNDLVSRYKKIINSGYDTDAAWEQADIERKQDLDDEVARLNKYIDGHMYLIGSMQKNGELFPAARGLKTDNVGAAIKSAVEMLSKTDCRLTLYYAENELVISQYTADSVLPSIFSFRSIPDDVDIKNMSADDMVDVSVSVGPLVKRTHRWRT